MTRSRSFNCQTRKEAADFVEALDKAGFGVRTWHDYHVRVTVFDVPDTSRVDEIAGRYKALATTTWQDAPR